MIISDHGKHLIVNGVIKECHVNNLVSTGYGESVIRKIIEEANMTVIGDIAIHSFASSKNKKAGYTINAMLMESHVTIHTWPESNSFTFDIFSCKDFNENNILDILKEDYLIESMFGTKILRSSLEDFKSEQFSFKDKIEQKD